MTRLRCFRFEEEENGENYGDDEGKSHGCERETEDNRDRQVVVDEDGGSADWHDGMGVGAGVQASTLSMKAK